MKLEGWIKPFPIQRPGPWAQIALENHRKQRAMWAGSLKTPTDGTCVWCNERVRPTRRHRWCGREECPHGLTIFGNPQSPTTRAWILIERQDFACKGCGLSFEEELTEKAVRLVEVNQKWLAKYPSDDKDTRCSYHQLGDGMGHKFQVDHIVPIFKGGDGIGLHNVQVLCVACHKRKTIEERK